MIKVVVFDLGNVLFDFSPLKAARNFIRLAGISRSPLEIKEFFERSSVETDYCEGKVTTAFFFEHVKEQFALKCSFEDFRRAWCDIFTIKEDSFALVMALKEAGYRLLVLSNTNAMHYDYLERMTDMLGLFDDVVLSFREYCQKPQQQIYEMLIQRAGCGADEIFFTDDLKENILAAQKSGIHAHRFRSARGLQRALTDHGVRI